MTVRRLLVLFNPCAGNGLVAARLAGLADRVPALADAVMGRIRSLDDAREAVTRAQGRVTTVVAAGGDGTVALAATAMLLQAGDPYDTAPSLAVIPLGTGNAFAHDIGVGTLDLALGTLRAGREIRCDVMRTNHLARRWCSFP